MQRAKRILLLTIVFSTMSVSHSVNAQEPKVLVFSRTAGFRHGSIPDGIELIQRLGAENGFAVDTTENVRDFTDENLSQYSAVVWLNTTGTLLSSSRRTAFENFIQNGGGYVGVHSAADTEYIGRGTEDCSRRRVVSQPSSTTKATMDVEDDTHISTQHLADTWSHIDEWYNFRNNPRDAVNVLLSVREDSYDPGSGAMGNDHPISWYHEYDGGRSWYTGLGHRSDAYDDPRFQQHLLGGILYAVPEPNGLGFSLLAAMVLFIRQRRVLKTRYDFERYDADQASRRREFACKMGRAFRRILQPARLGHSGQWSQATGWSQVTG